MFMREVRHTDKCNTQSLPQTVVTMAGHMHDIGERCSATTAAAVARLGRGSKPWLLERKSC
jgi:hypothetical protein